MNKQDLFVSVVAPLANDGGVLSEFVNETIPILRENYTNYELILVDDGSSDATVENIQPLLSQHSCVRFIRLSRSFGREVAITAGLESAIGDFVVIMLPPSDPPSLIPDMVELGRNGSGIVQGVSKTPKPRSWIGRFLASLFHWYFRRFLSLDLVPDSTEFRVLSRQAVNAVTQIKGRYRQLRLLSSSVGFAKNIFLYQPVERSGSAHKRPFWNEIAEGIDMIVIHSIHPLRFVSVLGLLASFLNLLYLGYVVAIYLFKTDVAEGWTTLSFQQGVMFFLIFVILTLLCEYVGRILGESREQPLYFIQEETNSSVLLSDTTRRNIVNESK